MSTGISVKVKRPHDPNSVNVALKKFKKQIQEYNLLNILRDKQEFTKPSERKRKAKHRAIRRYQREQSLES